MTVDRDDHKTRKGHRSILQYPGDPNLTALLAPRMHVNVVHTKESTIAKVELLLWYERDGVTIEEEFIVSGTAKVMPGDKFDAETGTKLALGRAYEKLGHKLLKQSQGRMRHLEDSRAKSKESKKARKKFCDEKKAIADAKKAERKEIEDAVRERREERKLEAGAKRPSSKSGGSDRSRNGSSNGNGAGSVHAEQRSTPISAEEHGLTASVRHRADL